jgi:hypothetical protein
MTSILNVDDPYGAQRHEPQCKYLDAARARRRVHEQTKGRCGIQSLNYRGGRGAGKTTVGILDMVNVALCELPGTRWRTAWTEPTHGDIDRILLNEMSRIVPRDLWKVVNRSGGYRYIEWASGHTTDLVPRHISNSNARPGLGGNLVGVFHDELAYGFDEQKILDIENSIRAPGAPFLFTASFSTPWQNGYTVYIRRHGSTLIEASSYDNPHLSRDVLDSRVAAMTPEQASQEIYGKEVALSGRIWKSFVEEPWPLGNIAEGLEWSPSRPWYLSVDLGVSQSAAIIWQMSDNGRVMNAVEEWTPNQMDFERLLKKIIDRYCDGSPRQNKPQYVWIGHDVSSPNSISGTSAATVLSKLGWDWTYPAGPLASKDLQRYHASSMLHQRKICIAAKRNDRGEWEQTGLHENAGKARCLLHVMRYDQYPSDGSDDVFIKDKKQNKKHALEDVRDCFLYAAICKWHPDLQRKWYLDVS